MRCAAQGDPVARRKGVRAAQPVFAVVYHRVAAPQHPVGAEGVGQRGSMAKLICSFLDAAPGCILKLFLVCLKLCLPGCECPAGHVAGKLLPGPFQTPRCRSKTALQGALTALFQLKQYPQKLCAVGHRQLCRCRRSRCTAVRHEIQNGKVDLVSDGADERHSAAVRRPGDDLGIEDPEVFPAAAAPGHDDLVHFPAPVQPPDGVGDLLRGLKALHADRAEQ